MLLKKKEEAGIDTYGWTYETVVTAKKLYL